MKSLFQNTSLKANIIANFVGNGWTALISLIFVPIYLNYIGPEGYGLIGIFASLQVVLFLLDSGLSTTLNKELASLSELPSTEQRMRNLVKTLGNVYWLLAVGAGLIAVFLSPLLSNYWVKPQELSVTTVTYSFILLSFSMIFQLPTGFYMGGIVGLQKQVALNAIKIIFATLKSIGALLVLVYISHSVIVFFLWNLIIIVIQTMVLKYYLWFILPQSPEKARFDKSELKKIKNFAFGMVGISLTSILLTQADKIILSKILSLQSFGYYSISCSLGLILYQILTPLTQSYFPKFTNLISLNKNEELKETYHQACKLISNLILPATFMLVFFSKELIFIWTKNAVTTEETWLITSIYAYGTGINCLMNIPYLLSLSYNWTKIGFYQNIAFLVLMVPLTIFLALHYSGIGGALTWAIINTLYFFITPIIIHKKILKGETWRWYWNDTIKPMLVCISLIAGMKYFLCGHTFNRYTELIILLVIGLITMVGSLSLTTNFFQKIKIIYQ